jgi:mercuric ion binding protein
MTKLKSAIAVICLAALSARAWAAFKTVTLNVPGMTCPACPITIKKTLKQSQRSIQSRGVVREEASPSHLR